MIISAKSAWEADLVETKRRLDLSRLTGDKLGEGIAQAALDNLLDNPPTGKTQQTEGEGHDG